MLKYPHMTVYSVTENGTVLHAAVNYIQHGGITVCMDAESWVVEIDSNVAVITLDRTDHHNSFTVLTMQELLVAFNEAVATKAVSAIVITGKGKAFCTGADLHEMREQSHRAPDHLGDLTAASHGVVEALRYSPKPVVSAVNGVAAGGGVGLALAADMVVMASSARFVLAFSRLGLSADCGATAALTHTLGAYRAREVMLLDEPIGAEKALEWGLANRVVADEVLVQAACDLARRATSCSRHTIEATKTLVQVARSDPLETSLVEERRAIMKGAAGEDFREGLQAFHGKRAPRFEGVPASIAEGEDR